MPVLTRRFGHRGAALIVLGVAWAALGLALATQRRQQRPLVLHEYLPLWLQVAGWVVTGAVAVAVGLRGPAAHDTPGMLVLLAMPLLRACSFAVAGMAWWGTAAARAVGIDAPVMGWHDGWYSAWVWVLVIVMLRLVAGWPNPRVLLTTRDR